MAEFITYAEPGSFEIDFKTTDYSEYREIEEAAREIIDRHTGTHDSDHISVDEHPQKTYAQDFFEKFPNAPKIRDGLPEPTACSVYGYSKLFEEHCESGVDCVSCWNEVMPDA